MVFPQHLHVPRISLLNTLPTCFKSTVLSKIRFREYRPLILKVNLTDKYRSCDGRNTYLFRLKNFIKSKDISVLGRYCARDPERSRLSSHFRDFVKSLYLVIEIRYKILYTGIMRPCDKYPRSYKTRANELQFLNTIL